MTERYVQLMEDLQYTKRETAAWREKYSTAEIQISTLQTEIKQLRNCIERLQQNNSKISQLNRQLSEEKDSILTDCSSEVGNIKDEINRKQRQIIELKELASPSAIDKNLIIRQIKHELNEQKAIQLEKKDKKISELKVYTDQIIYEREIQREKSQLKIKALQTTILEMQQSHLNQITDYTNKLYQQQQARPSEDKQFLRRTKRENEELRKKIELMNSELSATLEEKCQIHKDYSKWMNEHKKFVTDSQTEIEVYKQEINKLNELLQANSRNKDDSLLKDKDRDIKRLKNQLQQIRDEKIRKERRISDLEVEAIRLQNQIKLARNEAETIGNSREEQSRNQKERLQKDLNQARSAIERARQQNLDFADRLHDLNKSHLAKNNAGSSPDQQRRSKLRKQLSQQDLKQGQQQRTLRVEEVLQDEQKWQKAVRKQQGKVKQLVMKYLEMKKNYDKVQKKLQKANQKIVQLLQNKIVLASPKASQTKKIQFPTDNRTRPDIMPLQSPPIKQAHHYHPNQTDQQQHYYTSTQFKSPAEGKVHARTNVAFHGLSSPQEQIYMRIQDNSKLNEHQYYQKSLNLKNNQKIKQLRCLNHSHEKD